MTFEEFKNALMARFEKAGLGTETLSNTYKP